MLFDSEAPVADFGKLQLCESVRAVLMHQDYEIDLGQAPSMAALSSWLVETADWDLGLDLFRHFGNAAPECPDFTGTVYGFSYKCMPSLIVYRSSSPS